MANNLNLEVVTPQRSLLTEEVSSLVVPATEGYLGIMGNHTPIITGLQSGLIKYRQDGKSYYLAISSGFMEVSHNKVTILADSAERQGEIDRDRALAARERAEIRLKERQPGVDVARAEFALKRAIARLKALEHKSQ